MKIEIVLYTVLMLLKLITVPFLVLEKFDYGGAFAVTALIVVLYPALMYLELNSARSVAA